MLVVCGKICGKVCGNIETVGLEKKIGVVVEY